MTTAPVVETSVSTARDPLAGYLRQVLSAAPTPQNLKQILQAIPAAVRPGDDLLRSFLIQEVDAGRLYQFPPFRGEICYWDRPQREFARQALIAGLHHLRSKAEIVSTVSKRTFSAGVAKAEIQRIFATLVEAGELFKLPGYPGSRGNLFSAQPLDPEVYLRDALAKLSKKLGINEAELLRHAGRMANEADATRDPVEPAAATVRGEESPELASDLPVTSRENVDDDMGRRLLQAMQEVNPRALEGDMVSVCELRDRLDFQIGKQEFDGQMIRLAEQGEISLHPFDRPGMASAQDLEQYIVDQAGHYFNTISWRSRR